MGENGIQVMEGLALEPIPRPNPSGEDPRPMLKALARHALPWSDAIQACVQEFWNLNLPVKLLSVAANPHYYWHMQDFYVAQKGLDESGTYWAQLRLSEGLCQVLFETTLGKSPDEKLFTLDQIRNFEVFLLERFSRRLFQVFTPVLGKPAHKTTQDNPSADALIHLVWVLQGDPDQITQVILTVPQGCFKLPPEDQDVPLQKFEVADNAFFHAHADVAIRLGTTAARLEDLQHLEPEDVIVFENSHIKRWEIENPITGDWVPVSIQVSESRKKMSVISQEGWNAMAQEMQTKPTIWDNLQVEVTAAFRPIKLPLKQLKEMEQGLVVEVGDLMDNRVQIEVEGHPIAWGELLVLGDKFGVRIQGVLEAAAHVDQTSPAVSPVSPVQPQPPAEQAPVQEAPPQSATLMDLDLDESDFDDLDDEEDWT